MINRYLLCALLPLLVNSPQLEIRKDPIKSATAIEERVNEKDTIWQKIDEGLYFQEFYAPQKSKVGDSRISVVKMNPKIYTFDLLSASEFGKKITAGEWGKEEGLVAVINAGMFLPDNKHIGYAKNFNHLDNKSVNKYGAFFLCNPKEDNLPLVQIVGKNGFDNLKEKYNTVVQNMFVINEKKISWSKSSKIWSMAVLGADDKGNVLFIHSRSPYSVHDFAAILQALPLSIRNAMYLEGGPEASLYLSAKGVRFEKFGSSETGFNENDYNSRAWPLPTVIGAVKK